VVGFLRPKNENIISKNMEIGILVILALFMVVRMEKIERRNEEIFSSLESIENTVSDIKDRIETAGFETSSEAELREFGLGE
jgi:hypothetical protein